MGLVVTGEGSAAIRFSPARRIASFFTHAGFRPGAGSVGHHAPRAAIAGVATKAVPLASYLRNKSETSETKRSEAKRTRCQDGKDDDQYQALPAM